MGQLISDAGVAVIRLGPDGGTPPQLSLPDGQTYHLFISHVWRTGQDQAATIKRVLTLMLPSARIFLDVGRRQRPNPRPFALMVSQTSRSP